MDDYVNPHYIAWEIESRCNLGCKFCYSSSWNQVRYNKTEYGVLNNPTIDEIESGLSFLAASKLNIQYINWTGGEPLLRHHELGAILKKSRELGFKNIVSTNAFFSQLKMDKETFFGVLQEWSAYLDVLSVSLDAHNEKMNNRDMRVLCDGHHESQQFKDVESLIKAFKERRFPFSLKVNTLVTKKNKDNIDGLVDRFKDVPCIWHLVEFNPRQCPEENIPEFQLDKDGNHEQFMRLILDIERKMEASDDPCKFFITTRLYDGDNNPYCFLVINTKGDVLLPFGKEHKIVQNMPYEGKDITNWENKLTQNISEHIISSKDYGELGNPKSPVGFFNENNEKVLLRYLHRTANVVHSNYSLEWLRKLLTDAIQVVKLNMLDSLMILRMIKIEILSLIIFVRKMNLR